jgi:hypothetical protein
MKVRAVNNYGAYEDKYPYFGRHREFGKIVCFVKEGKGFVVVPDRMHSIGNFELSWAEDQFDRWYGTIEVTRG